MIEKSPSKLDPKHLEHYIKGGFFMALFDPLDKDSLRYPFTKIIGQKVIVHQNLNNAPVTTGRFQGHMFTIRQVHGDPGHTAYQGQVPEEDLQNLEILQDWKVDPEPIPVYIYRMVYTTRDQINANFGKGLEDVPLPFKVERQYTTERDDYIINELSKPQATEVWKAVWDPRISPDFDWQLIHGDET